MKEQYDLIKKLINEHNPDFVVIEGCQYQNNFFTFSQLSQMQGVIFGILFERNIGVEIVQPTAWKSAMGVRGKKRLEQKSSAIQIVNHLYDTIVSEDEAEAILIGCWAIKNIKEGE